MSLGSSHMRVVPMACGVGGVKFAEVYFQVGRVFVGRSWVNSCAQVGGRGGSGKTLARSTCDGRTCMASVAETCFVQTHWGSLNSFPKAWRVIGYVPCPRP